MFDAYVELGKNINQAYIYVENGCLAYNPYRINVGSIGLKTDLQKNEYISPAYVVFKCKDTLLPEFLYLVLRSTVFNSIIRENTTGSVRQTLSYDNLAAINIPVPSLSKQNQIIAAYNLLLNRATDLENEAINLEKDLQKFVFDSLGIKKKEKSVSSSLLSTVRFQNIQQWGYDKISIDFPYSFEKYKGHSLSSNPNWLKEIYRGKSPEYQPYGKCIILNQKCNRTNEIDLKYAKAVSEKWFSKIPSNQLTQRYDIMINSTGEGTLGRASLIVSDKHVGLAFDSHMLLLRLNLTEVDPLLFVYLFNSTFGQKQVDMYKSAQATKQTELGIENTKKIRFPLPDLAIQKSISNLIEKETLQISRLREEANGLYQKAKIEFEEAIFGE